ncbi:MAG TPA: S49 family peptidase [Bacteroidales bacterium]|nr:S49 family peptidase [Bacteroidales bacterium]
MKFRILSAILRQAWAIDERYAIANGGIIAGMINGMELDEDPEPVEETTHLPYAVSIAGESRRYSSYDDAPSESIAVIPVIGPLMKEDEDDCGVFTAGMNTLGRRLQEADQHPNISSIILYIDSPGGTVDGTAAFADIVKSAEKPVVTFIDGLMASAALWIGTSASRVVAQNVTTEIGSIGVMISFQDMQPLWEAKGVKFHRIVADQSRNKNKPFMDALTGDYEAIKKESLNPLADLFIDAVKANRPAVTEQDVFTGKMYFAGDALKLGLIDEIGNFDIAIQRAQELTEERKIQLIHTPIKPTAMKLPRLSAVLGVENLEVGEEGLMLSQEQLEQLEGRISDPSGTSAEGAIQPEAANTELQSQLEASQNRISELESELAEARRLPAENPAVAKVENDAAAQSDDLNHMLEGMSMKERIDYLNGK